jgi:hypothetical protein
MFVVYGARPGGALLGNPGACIGAFAMSGVVHEVGSGARGWDGVSDQDRAFHLMGVGGALESGLESLTGRRVGGFCGWVWTMLWTVCWGTLMIDGWARDRRAS